MGIEEKDPKTCDTIKSISNWKCAFSNSNQLRVQKEGQNPTKVVKEVIRLVLRVGLKAISMKLAFFVMTYIIHIEMKPTYLMSIMMLMY